jgi:hypothetical protein
MAHAVPIVGRLRLRAPSEAMVRRAVIRLEDALRTASLPDRGARMVIVRRLALGRIAATASTQSLALAVEARIAALGAWLVHAEEPDAEQAEAVWFRDPLEAHSLAALRAASGSPLDAWYWPLAVPALAPSGATRPVLRALAFSLASLDEAPAALPHWTATLVLAGHTERLLAALRPGDGAALLRSAGVDRDHAARVDAAGAPPRRDVPRPRRDQTVTQAIDSAPQGVGAHERPLGEHHAREDDRHVFVRAMLGRAGARAVGAAGLDVSSVRTAPPLAQAIAERSTATHAGEGARPSVPTSDAAGALRDAGPLAGPRSDVALRVRSPETAPGPRAHARRDARDARTMRSSRTADADSGPAESGPVERLGAGSPPGRPTRAGGLLFLVPLLERLGFERWRTRRDDGAPDPVAGVIFAHVLERLHVESDDPIWALGTNAATPRPFRAGERVEGHVGPSGRRHGFPRTAAPAPRPFRAWGGVGGHVGVPGRHRAFPRTAAPAPRPFRAWGGVGGHVGAPHDNDAHAWLSACRHALRRRVRIGLGSLVLRPARLALTPTHADVFFALDAADVRVRRAGLDIDPGWVPWLGRVLAFHYGSETTA